MLVVSLKAIQARSRDATRPRRVRAAPEFSAEQHIWHLRNSGFGFIAADFYFPGTRLIDYPANTFYRTDRRQRPADNSNLYSVRSRFRFHHRSNTSSDVIEWSRFNGSLGPQHPVFEGLLTLPCRATCHLSNKLAQYTLSTLAPSSEHSTPPGLHQAILAFLIQKSETPRLIVCSSILIEHKSSTKETMHRS